MRVAAGGRPAALWTLPSPPPRPRKMGRPPAPCAPRDARNHLRNFLPRAYRRRRARRWMSDALVDGADRNGIALRFAVGDRVRCRIFDNGGGTVVGRCRSFNWMPGTVVGRRAPPRWSTPPPSLYTPYVVKLDAQKCIAARLIYPPTDTDSDIQTSSEPPPPTPRRVPRPPTSRVSGASRDADSAAGEPRTPQTAAAPRAFIGPSPHGIEGHAVEGHAEVAARCMKEREEFAARCLQRMEVQRRSMAAKAEAKAAARAERVAARVEEVPPMPPKLRAKPQERRSASATAPAHASTTTSPPGSTSATRATSSWRSAGGRKRGRVTRGATVLRDG